MNLDDLKIEVYPEQEPKGMTVGWPRSGVRVEHLPTGTVAIVTNSRSQHKNRTLALEMVEWALSSKLLW